MPNQGIVDSGQVPGAPPVDAGKQGKHIPGHNNFNPKKSLWPTNENGVKLTQEGWLKGKPTGNPTVKTYTKGNLKIKVHIDEKGYIHGYPNYSQ
ncbi:polymorphic toxin type 50 domain-containing protein [Candidatus Dependentiae bacterium]